MAVNVFFNYYKNTQLVNQLADVQQQCTCFISWRQQKLIAVNLHLLKVLSAKTIVPANMAVVNNTNDIVISIDRVSASPDEGSTTVTMIFGISHHTYACSCPRNVSR